MNCLKNKIIATGIFLLLTVNTQASFVGFMNEFFTSLGQIFTGTTTSVPRPYIGPDTARGTLRPLVPPCISSVGQSQAPGNTEEWTNSDFGNPEQIIIDIDQNDFADVTMTHEFDIESILLRNSGWSEKQAKKEFQEVAQVFAQCGIRVNKVKLTSVDNSELDFIHSREHPGGQTGARAATDKFARRVPSDHRPLVILARDTGSSNSGYAHTGPFRYNRNSRSGYQPPPRMNTTYIGSEIANPMYDFATKSSVIAHELGHLLCQCSHTEDDEYNFLGVAKGADNLMNTNPHGPRKSVNNLTPQQCEIFKKSPMLKKIDSTRELANINVR